MRDCTPVTLQEFSTVTDPIDHLILFSRPCGEPCALYLRGAFSVFPGIEALVAFLIVALLYRPSSKKDIKRRLTSKCVNK